MAVCLIAYMYLYFRIFEPSIGCFFHYRGGHHERHNHQLNKMYTQCSFVQVQNSVLTCVHCSLYTKPIFFKRSLCVSIFSGTVNSNWSCRFSAIIKPASSPPKTDFFFSYHFRRWCCFTWCSKEGQFNKGMYTILLLFSIWIALVTSANLSFWFFFS